MSLAALRVDAELAEILKFWQGQRAPELGVCTGRDFWNFLVPGFFENFSPGIFWSRDFSALKILGFFSPRIF